MSKSISGNNIVRAWKDAEYRESLSADERATLPNHPAGMIDLSDAELESVAGAATIPNCIPGTATGLPQCGIMRLTFMAPRPGDGCQISVNNYTCTIGNPGTIAPL